MVVEIVGGAVLLAISQNVLSNALYDSIKSGKTLVDDKVAEENFAHDAVWSALEGVANKHDLPEAVLEAVLSEELNDTAVEDWYRRSDEEIIERFTTALEQEVDDDVDAEAATKTFLEALKRELSQQPQLGIPILVAYQQQSRDELGHVLDLLRDDLSTLKAHRDRALKPDHLYPDQDFQIHKEAAEKIAEYLHDHQPTVVTGSGGAGKSTILRTIVREWNDEMTEPVFLINPQQLGKLDDRGGLKDGLSLQNQFTEVIEQVSENCDGCLLVIDQLDSTRGRDAETVLQNVLLECAEIDGVSLLSACRTWDFEDGYRDIRDSNRFERIQLGLLEESEARRVLKEVGVPTESITRDLIDLAELPLHVALIASIVADSEDVDFETIDEEVTLWTRYRESLIWRGSTSNQKDRKLQERAAELAADALRGRNRTFEIEWGRNSDKQLKSYGVIEPEDEDRESRVHRFAHEQMEAYFYAWRATDGTNRNPHQILEDDGIDERAAADTLRWMAKLFRLKGAKQTEQFIRCTLTEVGGPDKRTLGYYAGSQLVRDIRNWNPSLLAPSVLEALFEALEEQSSLEREFYRELNDPAWVRPLVEHNQFDRPSGPRANYLKRVAPNVPDLTERAVREASHENGVILSRLLLAIKRLPPEHSKRTIDVFVEWIEHMQPSHKDHFADHLVKLIDDLVDHGMADDALLALDALLTPQIPSPEEIEAPTTASIDTYTKGKAAPSIVDLRFIEMVLENSLEGFVSQTGIKTVNLLWDHLRKAIELEAEVNDRVEWPWPQSQGIETVRAERTSNLKSWLLVGLRDALEHWVAADASGPKRGENLRSYLEGEGVVRQMGLYLLTLHLNTFPDLVERELVDESNYFVGWHRTEFYPLLRDGFGILSADSREEVLSIINQEPDLEPFIEAATFWLPDGSETDHVQWANEAIDRYRREYWWLIQQNNTLPSEYTTRLNDLNERYGEPDDPASRTSETKSYSYKIEERGPLNKSELAEISPEELVDLCISWDPPADQGEDEEATEPDNNGIRVKRTRSGFADDLRELVEAHPNRYLIALPQLVETDPAYVTAALSALQTTIEEDQSPAWVPVLILCETVVNQGRGWSDEADEAHVEDETTRELKRRREIAARREVCQLLITAAQTDPELMTKQFSRVRSLLLALSTDPDPTLDLFSDDWSVQSAFDQTLSAIRSLAVRALALYLWAVEQEGSSDDSELTTDTVDYDREVRNRLEELFDDQSSVVRVAVGQYIQLLFEVDPDLIQNNLDRLLPMAETPTARRQFAATWGGHLFSRRLSEPMFDLLRERYRYGISFLLGEIGEFEPGPPLQRQIAESVMCAYLRGYEELDSCIISEFYSVATPEIASTAASQLLVEAHENGKAEIGDWPRVRELWDWRLRTVSNITEFDGEFVVFLTYLNRMGEDIAFTETKDLLSASVPAFATRNDGWEKLQTYLLEQIPKHTVEVIEIYHKLVYEDDWPWLNFEEDARELVRIAVEHDHDCTHKLGLDIAERIAERGDPSFDEFIK